MHSRFPGLRKLSSQVLLPERIRPEITWRSTLENDIGTDQHFYMNAMLHDYVCKKPTPITLRQLIFFERHNNANRLLKSANYVRQELPIRMAHRIRQFQKLPFIVCSNPHIKQVYEIYWKSFERLRRIPPLRSLDENGALCHALDVSLRAHHAVVPHLLLGFAECQQYMEPDHIDSFMKGALCSRISQRLLSMHHLSLSRYPLWSAGASGDHRIPCTVLLHNQSARDTVAKCEALVRAHHRLHSPPRDWPRVVCEGSDASFTYVSDQVEYILYQLISSAVKRTMKTLSRNTAPIQVVVCSNAKDILFRVSDQADSPTQDSNHQLWSQHCRLHPKSGHIRQTAKHAAKLSDFLRMDMTLDIGLPASRVYAEYWGGSIDMVTMDGWGTDAYVRIPRLGTQNEHLIVDGSDEQRPLPWKRYI